LINNKKVLGIIPARGGSKRLPKKNILELCNKPLISWSIEAGLNSKYIDKILVTTDDNEIKNISKKYNIEIIDRPLSLAMDTSSTFEALEHAISMIKEKYEYIVLLQPTSPLRKHFHIDEAFELLISKDADAIISVSKMDHSPLWSNTLPKDNSMKDFLRAEIKNKRSQDLESYYQLNGAVFICKTDKLLEEKTFFLKENIFAYVMDKRYSIDIDEEIDFKTAELFLNYYK
jgi:CMP-N,N'-diacetyllegionaminic acid synthase